ncbi:MAG: 2'-5' RNA ligase family protein [Candidatus Nanoarchaeia archaeon]|nr:2'-5' RNA ligase family protein [Candidatus Nanoarchaeia archaeon]MDD5588328.1 2'-5' RNA ligase family protein [Candidatus Nanoarchaeia archaeon]
MKYLVHLNPSKELFKKINEYKNLIYKDILKDNKFLHCTLFNFSCDEKYEDELITSLESLSIKPFELVTKDLEIFDDIRNPNCLVLKLERNEEILNLHYKILERTRKFAGEYDKTFREANYNPHMTLMELKEKYIPGEKVSLSGIKFKIEEIDLSKKIQDWGIIKKFKLN